MKKNMQLILVILIVTVLTGFLYNKIYCDDCLTDADYKFSEDLAQHLKKKGDFVKVSEVYPGEWIEVCVYSRGANANAKWFLEKDWDKFDRIKILNNTQPFSTDKLSVISFIYSSTEMEVYRMPSDKMVYAVVDDDLYRSRSCVKKNDAIFRVFEDNTSIGGSWKMIILTTEKGSK